MPEDEKRTQAQKIRRHLECGTVRAILAKWGSKYIEAREDVRNIEQGGTRAPERGKMTEVKDKKGGIVRAYVTKSDGGEMRMQGRRRGGADEQMKLENGARESKFYRGREIWSHR